MTAETPAEKRRRETSEAIAEYVAKVVADWPPLTPEQIEAAARFLATVDPNEGCRQQRHPIRSA